MIIEGASTLFDFKSMQRLAEGVLTQIASLLNVECGGILVLRDEAPTARELLGPGRLRLLQPLRRPHRRRRRSIRQLRQAVHERVRAPRATNSTRSCRCSTCSTGSGREVVVLLETPRPLTDTDRSLVEVFCSRLSVAFDNVILYEQLQRGQRAPGGAGARSAPAR